MCLLAPVSQARAPKPPNFVGATVTFRDFPGVPGGDGMDADRIMSDGRGPYVNGGQRGLEVRMWINGSQDLTIGTFSSGRTLHFDYRFKDPGTGSGPLGMMSDNAFVAIRDIAAMAVGQKRTTKGAFNTAIGYFRWLGSPVPVSGVWSGEPYDSEALVVHRTASDTWEVYTPVPSDTGIAPDYTAGDLNVLLKDGKNTLTKMGNYHMAFGLTVTCPNCSGHP